jgi:cation-transporting ATPase 13A3/4/5
VAIYELKNSKENLRLITELKTLLFEGNNSNLLSVFCEIDIVKFPRLMVFQYKNITYLCNDNTNEFHELNFKVKNIQEIMRNLSFGLLESDVSDLRNLFGKCELSIEIDSYFKLALKEISDPFYVFQIFAVILWFFEDYITYSLLIIFATAVSLIMSVTATRENLENIKEMANTNCLVRIFRRNSV